MTNITIRGGHIIDPANEVDSVGDVVIADGLIASPGAEITGEIIDATGLIVAPGLIDVHAHLREPGFEHKETIETGSQAAARGGFTTVCAMPNTEPPTDSAGAVEFILRRAVESATIRVLPIACVTKGRKGHELAELAELAAAGAVAFSDDGAPIADAALMRRAIEYAGMLKIPVINHCEERALSAGGVMHEGWVSTRLGLRGIPSSAEEAMVARDIALAEAADRPVHLAHLSISGSVELVRQAKGRGTRVTAEVTPHHLALNHEAVIGSGETPGGLAYDTNAKVNPPLRSQEDTDACLAGLLDGTIDCIATDHAPHAVQDKQCEFDQADFGISGLETALALTLTRVGIADAIRALSVGPARSLGLDSHVKGIGTLSPGAPGDVVLIDPEAEWTVEPALFASKGKNTPLSGVSLKGRVVATVFGGKVVWQA